MKVNMSRKELTKLDDLRETQFFVLNGSLCMILEHLPGRQSNVYNFNEEKPIYVYKDTQVEYIPNKNIEITVK